jgi:GxxExxY protein
MSAQQKDPQTDLIIAAAIEVHRYLGPGLLESAYKECLATEFASRSIPFQREVPISIVYKGVRLPVAAYRVDFLVRDTIAVEIKAQEVVLPLHRSQLLTYIRLGGHARGLLINFGAARLVDGISRVANGWNAEPAE